MPDALLRLGFGFVEIGTVTPRAASRQSAAAPVPARTDGGVINRLGFNNEGGGRLRAARGAARSRRHSRRQYRRQPRFARSRRRLRAADRSMSRRRELFHRQCVVAEHAGPAQLAAGRGARRSAGACDRCARTDAPRAGPTPILLKIAPDLTLADLDDVVGVARERRVDGMIVGNTTISRPGSLRDRADGEEQGGLSGKPLFKLSTRMLAETYVRAEDAFPLIGVGGIDSGATAIAKIKAGATLVQLYTALVYRGIGVVAEIKAELLARAQARPAQARRSWSARRGRDHGRKLAGLDFRPFGAVTNRRISQIGITITAPSRK